MIKFVTLFGYTLAAIALFAVIVFKAHNETGSSNAKATKIIDEPLPLKSESQAQDWQRKLSTVGQEISAIRAEIANAKTTTNSEKNKAAALESLRQRAYEDAKKRRWEEQPVLAVTMGIRDPYSKSEQIRRRNFIEANYRAAFKNIGLSEARIEGLILSLVEADLQRDLLNNQLQRREITSAEYSQLSKPYSPVTILESKLSAIEYKGYQNEVIEKIHRSNIDMFTDSLDRILPSLNEDSRQLVIDTYSRFVHEFTTPRYGSNNSNSIEDRTVRQLTRIEHSLKHLQGKLSPEEMAEVNHFFQLQEQQAIQMEKLSKMINSSQQ